MITLGARLRGLCRRPADLPYEDAASRVSAYVNGNVLVMAALISLSPQALLGPQGVLDVLGVGLATFVALMVAGAVGRRIRGGEVLDWAGVRHQVRDTVPVVTAASVPAAILLLAWGGFVDARVVLVLALAITDLRLALLGSVVEWLSGERSSARLFLAGGGLALASAVAAVLRWWLTH